MAKIFLDSSNPAETARIIKILGKLDGQTTNPTLVAKHPDVLARQVHGKKFTSQEIFAFYKKIVKEIAAQIPQGSVSIEVYADRTTPAETMVRQAQEMNTWIPNAHIKLPTTHEGLKAAQILTQKNIRLNMTLCFSQEQAAAVYAASRGAKKGDIFISPFVGRLDDIGINGIDLIKNIIALYQESDHHVEVLAASVRNLVHFLAALQLDADIITAPFSVLKKWGEKGKPQPDRSFAYQPTNLSSIPYQKYSLDKNWTTFNIAHELTDKGIKRFAEDWNNLIP